MLSQSPLEVGLQLKDDNTDRSIKLNNMSRSYKSRLGLTPSKNRHIKSPTSFPINRVAPPINGEVLAKGGVITMNEDQYFLQDFVPPFSTHKVIQSFISTAMPFEDHVTKIELCNAGTSTSIPINKWPTAVIIYSGTFEVIIDLADY